MNRQTRAALDNYLTKSDECPDPSPESQQIYDILETAGVDQAIIDQVTKIVDTLAEKAATCAECDRRATEADVRLDEEIDAAIAGYEQRERDRWANMTEEEREVEVDRMIEEDPTCRD